MTDIKQHKAVYNVPVGDEMHRVEVLAPYGVNLYTLHCASEEFLRTHPGAQLLSRTWTDR